MEVESTLRRMRTSEIPPAHPLQTRPPACRPPPPRYTEKQAEYKEFMLTSCDIVVSIAEEYDLIPAIAETGLNGGMQDISSDMWYVGWRWSVG